MKSSTTIINRTIKIVLPLVFWITAWYLFVKYQTSKNPDLALYFATPIETLKSWSNLLATADYYKTVGHSLIRIMTGYLTAIIVGAVLGIVSHYSLVVKSIISPAMRVMRAVPVVVFIIYLYLLATNDLIPTVISFVMVTPVIWQYVFDSIEEIDKNLLEMVSVYQVGRMKKFGLVVAPSIFPSFVSGCVSTLGLAWKSGVAAEIICTVKFSIGGSLQLAKDKFDPATSISMALTIVIISLVLEVVLKSVAKKYANGRQQ